MMLILSLSLRPSLTNDQDAFEHSNLRDDTSSASRWGFVRSTYHT